MRPHTFQSFFSRSTLTACLAAIPLVLLLMASPLHALTYDVGTIAWTGGHTLTGTIETDGTLGTLTSSNIVDVNLNVAGPYPYLFDSTLGMSMLSVSATSTVLSTTDYFAFEIFFNGAPCPGSNSCDVWLVWEDYADVVEYRVRDSTTVSVLAQEYHYPGGAPMIIGTIVPEPSTVSLVVFGLLLLAGRRPE